jgi:hypothetical protein
MTPMVQPAAEGTQRYPRVRRLFELGRVSVTNGEDIRSSWEMLCKATRQLAIVNRGAQMTLHDC